MVEKRGGRGGPERGRRSPPRRTAADGGFGPFRRPEREAPPRRARPDSPAEPARRGDGSRRRSNLRLVGTRPQPASEEKPSRRRAKPAPTTRRRRRGSPADVEDEIRRLAG